MLSRTADNLYWLARYMERADCLARIIDAARHGGKALRGIDDAGETVGALHVAREPVEVIGGAGEH